MSFTRLHPRPLLFCLTPVSPLSTTLLPVFHCFASYLLLYLLAKSHPAVYKDQVLPRGHQREKEGEGRRDIPLFCVCVSTLAVAEIDCPSIVLCWGQYCSSCSHVANIFPDHPPIDSGCCRNGRVMCFPVPQSSDEQPFTQTTSYPQNCFLIKLLIHFVAESLDLLDHHHIISLEVQAAKPPAILYQTSNVH